MDIHTPTNPALRVNFRCACGHRFVAVPGRTEDCPERANHPFAYFAECPKCDFEASQAPWEIGLFSSMGKQTGPKTAKGKAASSANLVDHPTQAETQRTRFNALKHGLSAKVATYFPARPGQYPICKGCDVDWSACMEQKACMRQMITSAVFRQAFESGDPTLLKEFNADLQANVQGLIQRLF